MRPVNTKNPVSVWDYEALITEIDNSKLSNAAKCRKLENVYGQLRDAAWDSSHKALAAEQQSRAYEVARKYGGF